MVAPASRMSAEVAERVQALAGSLYPDGPPEIFFHPQCFASHGHFAGDDETRAQAFLDIANDESYDAVWFARGGYGSCRVVEAVMSGLTRAVQTKNLFGLQRRRHVACGALSRRLRVGGAWSGGAGHRPGRRRRGDRAGARLDDRSCARGVGAERSVARTRRRHST